MPYVPDSSDLDEPTGPTVAEQIAEIHAFIKRLEPLLEKIPPQMLVSSGTMPKLPFPMPGTIPTRH